MRVENHSDKHIYEACIDILGAMYDKFLEYLKYMDLEHATNPDDESCPCFVFSQQEIVQSLFLSHTTHGGSTSTRMKCLELGLDTSYDELLFQPPNDDEEEETEI